MTGRGPWSAGRRRSEQATSVARLGERGSASVLMIGIVAVAALMAVAVADIGIYLRTRAVASTAADAAALAAAPVTFAAFGDVADPTAQAAEFAAHNGAVLIRCTCERNTTWDRRTVIVVVAAPAALTLFGTHRVTATSSAEFDPTRLPVSRSP